MLVKLFRIVLYILLLAYPALSWSGPSFDCSKASTSTEFAICRSPRLSQLDLLLSQAYAAAKVATPLSRQDDLLASQKAWLAWRDRCGASEGCLAEAMQARIGALSGAPLSGPTPAPQPSPAPLPLFGTQLAADTGVDAASGGVPDGIWSAQFFCQYEKGKNEQLAARLVTMSKFDQRAFFQLASFADPNGAPRYAVLFANKTTSNGTLAMNYVVRQGIPRGKRFVVHAGNGAAGLMVDFGNCKNIQFKRDVPAPALAEVTGEWSGGFQHCGDWYASAEMTVVPAHEGNIFVDIEYHRRSPSKPKLDFPARF